MAIYNPDGSVYKVSGSFKQFNPNSPDQILFNRFDEEIIRIAGSPIYYYECLVQQSTVDKTYQEDRGKLYSPTPVELWAIYEPVESIALQTIFGMDTNADVVFEVNYNAMLEAIGHVPTVGSRLFTPLNAQNYCLIQPVASEFKKWGRLRCKLVCSQWQETLTTYDGKVTENSPDGINPNDLSKVPPKPKFTIN